MINLARLYLVTCIGTSRDGSKSISSPFLAWPPTDRLLPRQGALKLAKELRVQEGGTAQSWTVDCPLSTYPCTLLDTEEER